MHYHANAALTVTQRQELQRLHQHEGWSIRRLAAYFHVNPSTIQRWVTRTVVTDRSSAPHTHGRRVVTDAYRAAVLAERDTHPTHGPVRIAQALRVRFPTATATTVWRILHQAGRCQRTPKKTDASANPGGTASRAT